LACAELEEDSFMADPAGGALGALGAFDVSQALALLARTRSATPLESCAPGSVRDADAGLLPVLRLRLPWPEAALDAGRGPADLAYIRIVAGELRIGSLTTRAELQASALVREHFAVIGAAERAAARKVAPACSRVVPRVATTVGGVATTVEGVVPAAAGVAAGAGGVTPAARGAETVGAALCRPGSADDLVTALVAVRASLVFRSAGGSRIIPARRCYRRLCCERLCCDRQCCDRQCCDRQCCDRQRATAARPGELLVEVRIPIRPGGSACVLAPWPEGSCPVLRVRARRARLAPGPSARAGP
jgi:CO/xanthine dehydrogenase FAD-binding subunit